MEKIYTHTIKFLNSGQVQCNCPKLKIISRTLYKVAILKQTAFCVAKQVHKTLNKLFVTITESLIHYA